MAGAMAGVPSPHPLATTLPAIYQTDEFVGDLLDGLDTVLAPVMATLDSLDAYFDPHLAPADFLSWLLGWLDLRDDEQWNDQRRRRLLEHAGELFRWRGTRKGLEDLLWFALDVRVEVTDSGGSRSSTALTTLGVATPPEPVSPDGPAAAWVRVRIPSSANADDRLLDQAAAFAIPAHVELFVDHGDDPAVAAS